MKSILLKSFGLLTALSLVLVSCDNSDDVSNYPQPEIAYGLVANASPDAENLYFSIDQNPINTSGIAFGFAQGYFNFALGNRTLRVGNAAGSNLATKPITLTQSQIFSAFAVNRLNQLDLQVYSDSLVIPAHGKARIRFINLTPDLPVLKVTNAQNFEQLLDYKEAGEFFDFTPGTEFIMTSEDENVPVINVNTNTFNVGNIYTVYSKGLIDGASSATQRFSYSVIRNY